MIFSPCKASSHFLIFLSSKTPLHTCLPFRLFPSLTSTPCSYNSLISFCTCFRLLFSSSSETAVNFSYINNPFPFYHLIIHTYSFISSFDKMPTLPITILSAVIAKAKVSFSSAESIAEIKSFASDSFHFLIPPLTVGWSYRHKLLIRLVVSNYTKYICYC